MNASDILFRCSGLGHIMTNPRSGTGLSETCKTHLGDVYLSAKYHRKQFIDNKFMDKGNEREEDSITAVSRVLKTFFKKNTVKLKNEYIKGTPDLYQGESIHKADETRDTKTSWSLHTYFRSINDEVDKMYYWQGQGYMALSGANKHHIDYCLVNGTYNAIMDEKRRLAWRYGVIDPSTKNVPDEYRERVRQVEINHIFDRAAFNKEYPGYEWEIPAEEWIYDIPLEERVTSITIYRDEQAIERLYERVRLCRQYMDEYLFRVQKELVS